MTAISPADPASSPSAAKPRRRIFILVMSGLLLMASMTVMPAQPAAALTPNEKYIISVYEDFLLRGPSTSEMTWWSTYLGSGTRTAMVANVLGSTEFETLWVAGTRAYYLDSVEVEDPSFAADLAALGTSGDFVATETAVVSSSPYFALHGSTNTGFVEAAFNDILLRPSDPGGLAYWVGRLDAATSTRADVASSMIRSTEGAARRVGGTSGATSCASTELSDTLAVPAGSYCIVLDRMSDPTGQAYWTTQLAGSGQLPSLWTSHAASNEYYNLTQ